MSQDWALGNTDLHDRGVLLAPLYEFVVGELRILIPVHVLEDLVHSLNRGRGVSRLRDEEQGNRSPFLEYLHPGGA